MVHCSLCGQTGHNKRNRKCSVNVQTRAAEQTNAVAEHKERVRRCFLSFNNSLQKYIELEAFIASESRVVRDIDNFVRQCISRIEEICSEATNALEINVISGAVMIGPDEIAMGFQNVVEFVNQVVRYHTRLYISIIVKAINNQIVMQITELPRVKKGSDFLKEIVVVHDLTVEESTKPSECPICFEEIDAADILRATCSHSFCITCIKGLTTAIKDTTNKPCCPMCRSEMTKLTVGTSEIYGQMNEYICNL